MKPNSPTTNSTFDDEQRRLENETRVAALKAESERIRQAQEDERQARLERETRIRHESSVRKFADQAGEQIVSQVGGGQDLIVSVRSWTFDRIENRFDADVSVSFNGAVFRGNNYLVEGRLRVQEDGSSPQFSRNSANDKFKKLERNLKWAAAGAAGVIILKEMKSSR